MPLGCRGLERWLTVRNAIGVAGEHSANLLVVQLREPRGAQRDQQRSRLLPVGVIRRIEDLLRPDEAVEAKQVERAPDRRVEEDARLAAEPVGERREVGDSRVRDDELRVRIAIDYPRQVVRDRRQAAAAVDEDRDLPVGGELEDRGEALVVQQELLRPGMELDSLGAAVEHPCRLADRILREIQADEGDHPSV